MWVSELQHNQKKVAGVSHPDEERDSKSGLYPWTSERVAGGLFNTTCENINRN